MSNARIVDPAIRRAINERGMPETNRQREAVARLTTFCERIIQGGKLPGAQECELRLYVNQVCNAFDMATVQERAPCP